MAVANESKRSRLPSDSIRQRSETRSKNEKAKGNKDAQLFLNEIPHTNDNKQNNETIQNLQ